MREFSEERPLAAKNYEEEETPKTSADVYTRADHFDKHPEEITWEHLENILGKMPGSLQSEVGRKTHPHETIAEVKKSSSGGVVPDFTRHSRRFLGKTYEQFHQDVVTAFETAGVDVDEFEEQNKNLSELPPDELSSKSEELKQQLVDVYLELRKMGYRHYDIVT